MNRLLPLLIAPLAAFAAGESLPPFEMSIERLDPALDALIEPGTKIEKLAAGFNWSEGPTWYQNTLVFSDVPENIVYQWKPGETRAEVFIKPSGLTKPTPGFKEQGSNGLTTDANGALILCQHGDRRISRYAKGKFEPIVTNFEGKHFNSPNDLAYRKNGDLYFTDPPYGLEGLNKSPLKELSWNGVYRADKSGKAVLLIKDLTFPNGIAFSPDEKVLYVAVSDPAAPRIMAYEMQADGGVTNGRVFFDAAPLQKAGGKGLPDGLKVDKQGNVWATGPGGVLVLTSQGKHLGTIRTNQATGNCAWGGADRSELYITADVYLARVKTKTSASSAW